MIRKIIFGLLVFFLFQSCNPFYKQYKDLTSISSKKNHRFKKKDFVFKKILNSQDDKDKLLIISWENNVFDIKKLLFHAILYDYKTKKITYLYNIRENQNKIISVTEISTDKFYSEMFILENYLNGKENYLLSLHDSFSNSELQKSFDVYDFKENKIIRINSIYFKENGELIQ